MQVRDIALGTLDHSWPFLPYLCSTRPPPEAFNEKGSLLVYKTIPLNTFFGGKGLLKMASPNSKYHL